MNLTTILALLSSIVVAIALFLNGVRMSETEPSHNSINDIPGNIPGDLDNENDVTTRLSEAPLSLKNILDLGCSAWDKVKFGDFEGWKNSLSNRFNAQSFISLLDQATNHTLLQQRQSSKKEPTPLGFAHQRVLGTSDPQRVVVLGDTHGSSCAVAEIIAHLENECGLDTTTGKMDQCLLVFLGDVMDRGKNSLEVLLFILYLKIQNPDNIYYLRGNHESFSLMEHWGSIPEMRAKLHFDSKERKQEEPFFVHLNDFFNTLPSVLYIGKKDATTDETTFFQFSHGSFEAGWNPFTFLDPQQASKSVFITAQQVKRMEILRQIIEGSQNSKLLDNVGQMRNDPQLLAEFKSSQYLGFHWHDYCLDKEIYYQSGRGLAYGQGFLKEYLSKLPRPNQSVLLKGIFRAHQHNNAMFPLLDELVEKKGVVNMQDKFWPPSEYLFFSLLSASESQLGFPYHSMTILDFQTGAITHHFKEMMEDKWETSLLGSSLFSIRK